MAQAGRKHPQTGAVGAGKSIKAMTEKKKFNIRKYVSPVFLALLALSFLMWFLTKLSYTYTAEVPVDVDIDGNKFRVTCIAEGVGYRILGHRTFNKSHVTLRFRDVHTTPSVISDGHYVVDPYSLQNAISVRNSDIKIISIGDIPDITYNGLR